MNEVTDITAYAFESIKRQEFGDPQTLEAGMDNLVARLGIPAARWPVRNREERTPIPSQKRAIIHERDGGACRICGTGGHMLTIDHIIPRSTFTENQLHIADRSDNLISACFGCNEEKSNYEYPQDKRLGVTAACWECQNSISIDNEWDDDIERPHMTIQAFCGRCGITRVPDLAWVL